MLILFMRYTRTNIEINMARYYLAYVMHFLAVFALKTAISGHYGRIQAQNGLIECLVRAIMPKVLAKVL